MLLNLRSVEHPYPSPISSANGHKVLYSKNDRFDIKLNQKELGTKNIQEKKASEKKVSTFTAIFFSSPQSNKRWHIAKGKKKKEKTFLPISQLHPPLRILHLRRTPCNIHTLEPRICPSDWLKPNNRRRPCTPASNRCSRTSYTKPIIFTLLRIGAYHAFGTITFGCRAHFVGIYPFRPIRMFRCRITIVIELSRALAA